MIKLIGMLYIKLQTFRLERFKNFLLLAVVRKDPYASGHMKKTKSRYFRKSCKDITQDFQEIITVIMIMRYVNLLLLINDGTEADRASAECFAAKKERLI